MKSIKFLFLSLLTTFSVVVFGQICPAAPNFMDLNSPCVVCNYGNYDYYTGWNPFIYTGIANTRHTLITTQGFDPNTGNKLPMIPEGDSVSIRLGNPQIGAEAEAITYNFKVEHDKALLSVKFAVVLEDPGHSFREQPRFIVRILNEIDELVETCAEYDVTARDGIPGFETYYGYGCPIRWRPWTTVALDLSSYIGQDIKVQFITYDCSQSGHFGYAYFTAECLPSKLSLTACKGDTVQLSAPPFCESYLWTNGDTTSSTTYVKQDNQPIAASCLIRSVTGCEFTLNAYISDNPVFTKDTVICDIICEGEPYHKNYFDLPPQYRTGTFSHVNSFYINCIGTVNVYLELTVQKRMYHIEDMICYGQDYIRNGFSFIKPMPGIIRDTQFSVRSTGCDSIVYLTLTVSPDILTMPDSIFGNTFPCSGELEVYNIPQAELFVKFHWIIPENTNVVGSQNAAKIFLQFTDEAISDTLKLYVANGCGGDTLRLFIEPKISHYLTFTDSICTGSSYNENDFNIPRQDSVGVYAFSQKYSTQDGCDSVRTLRLYVFPTPEVEILSSADVICKDDSVELHVISTTQNVEFFTEVNIGDFYCSDGSIVPFPSTYDGFPANKTAVGMVFWVSPDETYAWVSSLDLDTLPWSTVNDSISGGYVLHSPLPALTFKRIMDTFGFQNTIAMRQAGDSAKYPIAYNIDVDQGWFLPGITQMRVLLAVMPVYYYLFGFNIGRDYTVFFSLLDEDSYFWTSTQFSMVKAWAIDAKGGIKTQWKNTPCWFVPIKQIQLTKQ